MRTQFLAALVAAMLVGVPAVASAQQKKPAQAASTPSAEVAGGYQFLRDLDADENLVGGWFGSAGVHLSDAFSVVGEVSGSYHSDFDFNLHTFLGGVRGRFGGNKVEPFAQLLIGAAHARSGGASVTDFAMQPGAGVDFKLSNSVAARLGVDYRHIVLEADDGNQFRWYAGLVAQLGR